MPSEKNSMSQNPDILGIGAPFVDHIIQVSEEYISQLPGKKGGMWPVDYRTLTKIINSSGSAPTLILGGSGANTIKGLANFGYRCALSGKIGTDEAGRKFLASMKSLGITSFLQPTHNPTSQVVCLITPDKERTMRAFLGASEEMRGEDLDPRNFVGVRLVHIEGYSIMKEGVAQRAMELAKSVGAKVSFDLGSFEVVKAYKKALIELLARYVDIVFSNQEETLALTGREPEKGCEVLRDICETAVILLGKEGCLVGQGTREVYCPAFKVDAVDSTGAGDLFASGFLHGVLQGCSLEECARYGALTGAAVVQVVGVDIPPQSWDEIKRKISKPE